jgi:hypothetical protein
MQGLADASRRDRLKGQIVDQLKRCSPPLGSSAGCAVELEFLPVLRRQPAVGAGSEAAGAAGEEAVEERWVLRVGLRLAARRATLFVDREGEAWLRNPHGIARMTARAVAEHYAFVHAVRPAAPVPTPRSTTRRVALALVCVLLACGGVGGGGPQPRRLAWLWRRRQLAWLWLLGLLPLAARLQWRRPPAVGARASPDVPEWVAECAT